MFTLDTLPLPPHRVIVLVLNTKLTKCSLDHLGESWVNVDRLGDGVRREVHSHGVSDLLNQHRGVATDDMAAENLAAVWIGEYLYESVQVQDGGSVGRVGVVVGGSYVMGAILFGLLLRDADTGDLGGRRIQLRASRCSPLPPGCRD